MPHLNALEVRRQENVAVGENCGILVYQRDFLHTWLPRHRVEV